MNKFKGEHYMKKMSRQEKSWILYDWANSVYSLVITTVPRIGASIEIKSVANEFAYPQYAVEVAPDSPASFAKDLKNVFSHSSLDSVSYLQVC
jgi:hypothetical protein